MKRALLPVALSLSACSALTGPPQIEDRFASSTTLSDGTAPAVTIAVSSAPIDSAKPGISVTQLSDRGQAALIEQTKGKPPVTLNGDDSGAAEDVVVNDAIQRHLVVAVRPVDFLPAGDRVDAIRIKIEVAAGQIAPWRVTSWTQASNGETVIDMGKLTDISSTKLTASTGLGLGPSLPNATVGAEADHSATREVELKDTTAFDAAVDNDGHAWLDETAGWRVTLAHNLSMDTTLTIPQIATNPLKVVSNSSLTRDDPKSNGSTLPALPEAVRLIETTVVNASEDRLPVCGHAHLDYRVRQISTDAARSTFSESDDDVTFLRGFADTNFLFAPAPYQPTYLLRSGGLVLSYALNGKGAEGLRFASLAAATAFRDWLVETRPTGGRVANGSIGIARLDRTVRPLTRQEMMALLTVVADPDTVRTVAEANAKGCPSTPAGS